MKKILFVVLSLLVTPLIVVGMKEDPGTTAHDKEIDEWAKKLLCTDETLDDTTAGAPSAENHLPPKKRKLPRALMSKEDVSSLDSNSGSDAQEIDLSCTDEEDAHLETAVPPKRRRTKRDDIGGTLVIAEEEALPPGWPTILCRQQPRRTHTCGWRSRPNILLPPRPRSGKAVSLCPAELRKDESASIPPTTVGCPLESPSGREIDLYAHEPPLNGEEIDLLTHEPPLSSDSDDENVVDGTKLRAQQLVRNIETRVAQMREHLDAVATTESDVHNLAIILDIDDTCICSPESFGLLIQNPASPWFNAHYICRAYHPYPIAPVHDLFTWAKATGFRIFFLTARPEKHPHDPTQDVTDIHKQMLVDAGYDPIDGRQVVLICMPIETHLRILQPENREDAPDLIGAWKRAQHERIARTYGCRIVAVLDDQPENIDRSKTGHMRIPSPTFPDLTPQRKGRVGLGGPGISCCLRHIPTRHTGLDEEAKQL